MLFITRRVRESLMIGDDIEVFVVSVRGDTVRIGIEAPCKTGIFRKEVYLEIEEEGVRVKGEGDDDLPPAQEAVDRLQSTRRSPRG